MRFFMEKLFMLIPVDSTKLAALLACLISAIALAADTQTTATLTMAATPAVGGTTGPAVGSYAYNITQTISITATPSQAYSFTSWTAFGGAVVADASAAATTIQLTGDATVTANFAQSAQLAMAVSPDTSMGGTTPTGTTTVLQTVAQSITATPSTNYHFVNWTATSGASVASPTTASTTVTLTTEAATVTAVFAHDQASVTMAVSPADSGTTTPAIGVFTIDTLAAQNITTTPSDGFLFTGWEATGSATLTDTSSDSCYATMTGDATLTANYIAVSRLRPANFQQNYYKVTNRNDITAIHEGLTFSTTIPGNFSSFTNETPLTLVIGGLNVFGNLGTSGTTVGFTTLGKP